MPPVRGTALDFSSLRGLSVPGREDCNMKTAIVALSAAALVTVLPAALAQAASSKTTGPPHEVSRKHHTAVSRYAHAPPREMHARGSKNGYPGAFGYAPSEPGIDRDLEMSRQAGGGGGGGGM
jgi:hypothetical protein